MAQGAADTLLLDQSIETGRKAAAGFAVRLTHRIAEVEPLWRGLTAGAIESPGQDFGFIRLWTEAFGVAEADQFYVAAYDGEAPVALMVLQRRWSRGVRVLSWFPGAHVGCGAPIIDTARVAAMAPARRRRLWLDMLRGIGGADLVYLKSVPQLLVGGADLFAELGQSIAADTLYRAHFASFDDADRTQRNKSRRKHDRQQGEKLEALGTVSFEELGNGPQAVTALDTMFRQRAARFREMGVFNPFDVPAVRKFYDDSVREGSGVAVKLHLLRLNGEIVAMRYSIVHGERLFCLISSMSEDAALRPGSPGKQCLLRVMQSMFGEGFTVFDMGEGFTDEKRHWCNEQIPVRHHYVPITRRGALAASVHRGAQVAKARIKSEPRLLELAKRARGAMLKLSGRGAASAAPAQDAD